jgi:hypothetical protein
MEMSGQLHAVAYLPPRKRDPRSTHWIGGWVSPRADLDAVAKRKNPFTALSRNRTVVVEPVA